MCWWDSRLEQGTQQAHIDSLMGLIVYWGEMIIKKGQKENSESEVISATEKETRAYGSNF